MQAGPSVKLVCLPLLRSGADVIHPRRWTPPAARHLPPDACNRPEAIPEVRLAQESR